MRIKLLAGLLSFAPAILAGQKVVGPSPSASDCNAAVASLTAGQRTGNWGFIAACGEAGANAVATAIQNARLETDSTYLKRLWNSAASIRHPAIFSASRNIAADNGATVGARAVGLMILLAQFDNSFTLPWKKSWTELTTIPLSQSCPIRRIDGGESDYGYAVLLPPSYLTDLAATTDQVGAESALPLVTRDLARCIRRVVSYKVPIPQHPGPFVVSYICGNKFRVQNAGDFAQGTYQVQNTSELRDIAIPAQSAVVIFAIQMGSLIVTAPGYTGAPTVNRGVPCS